MHLRIVCPGARTEEVVEVLRSTPGATSVTVLRGAVVQPAGDLLEADVAREAVDDLIADLERRGLDRDGVITLETLDTAAGREVEEAERAAPGEGVDAVVWRELVERTKEDSTLSTTFLIFLVVATLIAAIGLLTDSQVLIVGAMVLGPEFSALAGLAVALVDRDGHIARLSLRALVVGFAAAVAVTAAAVLALQAADLVPAAYLSGRRPLTSFVSSPDVFSVVVALLAGVAGTVSLTAAKTSTLVGVFISVTTVPAAAEIAAAGVTGQGDKALGSVVQLVVNLVCITLAAVATLVLQRAALQRVHRRSGSTTRRAAGAPGQGAPAGQARGSSGP
jgi:uncharacterized hydrophobic protein (TIGR00271 family)